MPEVSLPVVESESPREPWYRDGLRFGCTQCGNCCTGPTGFVWITDEEIERLADYLKLSVGETIRRYCRKINGEWSLKERRTLRGEYDCVFLKPVEGDDPNGVRRRGCSVYPVRPQQCRTWPFWDGLLTSRRAWEASKSRCPGIDRGKFYAYEEIERQRQSNDGYLDRADTRQNDDAESRP